jgi:hypothetical protein
MLNLKKSNIMKKIALLFSLVSFVAFIGLSSGYAQDQKEKKETAKTEKVSTDKAATKDAACPHMSKDAKCSHAGEKGHTCTDACKKGGAACCKEKKDGKCAHMKDAEKVKELK